MSGTELKCEGRFGLQPPDLTDRPTRCTPARCSLSDIGQRGAFIGVLAIEPQAQALIAADDDLDHVLGPLLALAHAWQIDHAGGDERGSDHEDDQQHQHHVDEGHHVDLADGAAA
jgi:hypothetical protein